MGEDRRTTGYRSGVAARLAGIPVETLRVWERRYGVVGPQTSARGHRLYSAEDVSRLAVLRQLVDLGTAIGSVARLPLDDLRDMLSAGRAASRGVTSERTARRALRLAVVGTVLGPQLERDAALIEDVEVVARSATPAEAANAMRGVTADVLAVEMAPVHAEALAQVDALVSVVRARHAIVAYRFAPAALLSALRDAGHVPMRAPLDLHQVRQLYAGDVMAAAPRERIDPQSSARSPASRRFDDDALMRIAGALTTLACECPRHVVDLVISLGAFERYSAECADRSPADATLHRYLQNVAGAARAGFEEALVQVTRAEGLSLPTLPGPPGS